MAAHFMARGAVQKVIVGADRIAANGDVANKIGTYGPAVLAAAHGIPFYVAAPAARSTPRRPAGRHPHRGARPGGGDPRAGPAGGPGRDARAHPAFDVTPARYVTAIVTEAGVHRPPYGESLRFAHEAPVGALA